MTLIIDGHTFHYEMENLCRLFFPYHKIKVLERFPENGEDRMLIYTGMKKEEKGLALTVRVQFGEYLREQTEQLGFPDCESENTQERHMAVLLFQLLTAYCGFVPKWGILTGVRPIKLMRRLISEMGEAQALDYYRKELLVSEQKTKLSDITMKNEEKILSLSKPESFSLYISIPFCPTRCSYCSFVSSSVEKTAKLVPGYLELLCREIAYTAQIAASLKLRLETVYIGGGTPTTLSAEQLTTLLSAVRECFDLSFCREFTVEAGRPDTITAEKLLSLKKQGVTRISINPQTLNDEVLKTIGRRHTAEQTLSAFALARKIGFDNINMDLIAGLPNDSLGSFVSTLDRVIQLAPESITVHTLSLKRSASLFQDESEPYRNDSQTAEQMIDYADEQLFQYGYKPYYLYRQSRMVGNLENTGWAKPGFESPYNVFIMDETHTILACGAGAVSKIKDPYSDCLNRIFNFKYPYEYMNRFEEMIIRKDQVKANYGKFHRISERTPSD